LHEHLVEHDVQMVILAGFMRILTPWFVNQWSQRMINIHPSLLPKYPGLHTHQRAIEAGDQEAGCSVHWVTEGVDEGDVIAQSRVPIRPDDDAESLAARVLPEEHALYPKAANMAAKTILEGFKSPIR
jgi:phosphoribosylglycinamide formyltransferase-1